MDRGRLQTADDFGIVGPHARDADELEVCHTTLPLDPHEVRIMTSAENSSGIGGQLR